MPRSAAVALSLALTWLFLLTGCDDQSTPTTNSRAIAPRLDDVEAFQQDDLNLGVTILNSLDAPADQLALYHLNQWLAREARKSTEWKPSSLTQRIPKSLAAIQPMQELDRMRLTRDDLSFLYGRIWQRDVGRWVRERPLEGSWAGWMEEQRTSRDDQHVKQLTSAVQLFDWTVRNVQLDPFPEPEEAKAVVGSSGDEVGALPPQRGVPGPGYQRYPYETMLYGHGDSYERARVFIELCRQQEIDAVVLAVRRTTSPLRPWAVAIMIGEELYLFDPELGLPLPGPNQRGVVTLAQLARQPELLEQLHVDEKHPYWVVADDLESLEVLLSASPEELSKRMWVLDRELKGEKHLELFVDADVLAQRVKQSPQLAGTIVSLWRVPFECSLFALGRGLRLSRDPAFAADWERETHFLQPGFPLRVARQKQFQGKFDSTDDEPGAVAILLDQRPPERAIEDLLHSDQLQQDLGLKAQLSPKPEERRKQLEMYASLIQQLRDDVSYWLGLVQYEKRDYENAIVWLKRSIPEEGDANPWEHGARYNLARCYEALGKHDEAIKLYRDADSPQKHGDRLRAKWLE